MDLHQNGPSPWPKSNRSGWPEDPDPPTPEATMIPGLGKLVNSCEKCSLGRVSCVQSATKFPVVGSTDKYSLAARIRTRLKMWPSCSSVKVSCLFTLIDTMSAVCLPFKIKVSYLFTFMKLISAVCLPIKTKVSCLFTFSMLLHSYLFTLIDSMQLFVYLLQLKSAVCLHF